MWHALREWSTLKVSSDVAPRSQTSRKCGFRGAAKQVRCRASKQEEAQDFRRPPVSSSHRKTTSSPRTTTLSYQGTTAVRSGRPVTTVTVQATLRFKTTAGRDPRGNRYWVVSTISLDDMAMHAIHSPTDIIIYRCARRGLGVRQRDVTHPT
jgi:hypothetical protein